MYEAAKKAGGVPFALMRTSKEYSLLILLQVRTYYSKQISDDMAYTIHEYSSRKRPRTKVTPDFHLTYSKNGENLGS